MTVTEPIRRSEIPAGMKLAGRYSLRERLATGGMATVYRALDESSGRLVALKHYDGKLATKPEGMSLFEREYRTLATLRHPRIIEVYDYGLYEGRPFYTMELLDGEDLRRLSPLSYPQACAYMRDVASSLALLHARGFLHRDVSPVNVRVTADGRAKLIDFGALASFGRHSEVIGTPQCIAPEVLQGLPLDARSDLFSLGAVFYFLLTARHAFPARTLAQAPLAWQIPPTKPSDAFRRLGADSLPFPAELDELVLSLLSLDSAGRPASAGLVIERLNAIAGLEPERDVDVIESYLAGTATIGRDAEIQETRNAVDGAIAGSGGALFIAGATGAGKSRMLSELTLEAQVRGATVIRIDAALGRESGALAHALIDRLVYERPGIALESLGGLGEEGRVLAAFQPRLLKMTHAVAASIPQEADEWRMRVQSAVSSFLQAIAERSTVVVAIDNLDQADEFSATLALAIAASARGRHLLLATAAQENTAGAARATVNRLAALADRVELKPLDGGQTVGLVRSLFGDAPHTVRVAEWIYNVSGGSPMDTVELARHLVRNNVIRYLEGTWILPQEIAPHELPQDLGPVWRGRLAQMSVGARSVARAVSIYRRAFSLEQAVVVCGSMSRDEVKQSLDELIAHGALQADGDSYRFLLAPLQRALESELDDSQRQRLHARVSEHLLPRLPRISRGQEPGTSPDIVLQMLETGAHLTESGQVERGSALSLEACRLLLYNTSQIAAAHVPFLEAVLMRERAAGNAIDALVPLCLLGSAGYTVERHLAERYGDEAVQACRRATGLALAGRLRPFLGMLLSTAIGLAVGVTRHVLSPRRRRRLSVVELFQMLLVVVASLVGTATICRDAERAKQLTASLEPFVAFGHGNVLALFHEYCTRLTQIIAAREADAYAGWKRLLVRLEDPKGMPGVPAATRDLMLGGALYALGVLENFQESARSLELVKRLEGLGSKLYELVAAQLRTQYHAQRGEMELAKRWAERVETLAVQKGTAWQAEVWISTVFGVASYHVADLVALKRAREQAELLEKSLPALQLATRGRYLLLRGDYHGALSELKEIRKAMPPNSFTGWAVEWGPLAEAYNLLGLPGKAREVCLEALAHVDAESRCFVWLYAEPEIQLAIADALLGDHDVAAERLDRLIDERRSTSALASSGRLHEARTRVALLAKDHAAFDVHFAEMNRIYRQTGAQGLLRKCERLRDLGDATFHGVRDAAPAVDLSADEQVVADKITSVLSERTDRRQAYERALDLIATHFGASGGYLFILGNNGASELVASQGDEPAGWIVDNVHALVDAFDPTLPLEGEVATIIFQDAKELSTLPLVVRHGAQPTLIGVVALLRGADDFRVPSSGFLSRAAEAIAELRKSMI